MTAAYMIYDKMRVRALRRGRAPIYHGNRIHIDAARAWPTPGPGRLAGSATCHHRPGTQPAIIPNAPSSVCSLETWLTSSGRPSMNRC